MKFWPAQGAGFPGRFRWKIPRGREELAFPQFPPEIPPEILEQPAIMSYMSSIAAPETGDRCPEGS
jgi:hypothetical protein